MVAAARCHYQGRYDVISCHVPSGGGMMSLPVWTHVLYKLDPIEIRQEPDAVESMKNGHDKRITLQSTDFLVSLSLKSVFHLSIR